MTHEFINIVKSYIAAKTKGLKSLLITVVDLDGSSYRKPGVRMLILEDETMVGAVSGGCVEKEILRQSQSVFKNGISKVITYDGRFRLGCEGILYILIEVFNPETGFLEAFNKCLNNREPFKIQSQYLKESTKNSHLGSQATIGNHTYKLSTFKTVSEIDYLTFEDTLQPPLKLVIFGAEHDAIQLCHLASITGFSVSVYASASETKTKEHFIGCSNFNSTSFDNLILDKIDNQTAVVVMTHGFTQDLKCLLALKDEKPAYIGLLGPTHKRENLLSKLIELSPDISESFLDKIHGPTGLNIGAETPQEIAVSILSEILSVLRNTIPVPLKEKSGNIHT